MSFADIEGLGEPPMPEDEVEGDAKQGEERKGWLGLRWFGSRAES